MQININLSYLKCFYDAALMGSVSESARRNFVSQSAVSQAIAKLEKALGVLLCLHKKQQFKLTKEGEIVFEKAKEIFSSVRRLQDALDQHHERPKMPLHFVTTHSIGLSLLPDFIAEFKQKYPDIEIHFQFGGLTQIKGWLKQGIAEFALVLQSPHVMEYQEIFLYAGKFGLYKHKKETKSLKLLGAYVEHKDGMMVSEFQTAYRALHHQEMPICSKLNSWEFIARSMENSHGYGLIPDLITLKGRYPYLVPASEPQLPYNLCAIFPKGEQLSYSAQTFLNLLKEFI
jgi:DNA-binding transcriptional LysR family regulator